MEVKICRNGWRILDNDEVMYELPRKKTPYKVKLNVVDYKQRIFCEHYVRRSYGERSRYSMPDTTYYYTFYRFDDAKEKIIKLFDSKFSEELSFNPRSGFILLSAIFNHHIYFVRDGALCELHIEDFEDPYVCGINKDYICFCHDEGSYVYDIKAKRAIYLGMDTTMYISEDNVLMILQFNIENDIIILGQITRWSFYNVEDIMNDKFFQLLCLLPTIKHERELLIIDGNHHKVCKDGQLQLVDPPSTAIVFPLSLEYLIVLFDSTFLLKDLIYIIGSYLY